MVELYYFIHFVIIYLKILILFVLGNITTTHINNIDLKNVVVDHDTQIVQNTKRFANVVFINGDFNVKQFNGNKLSQVFKNAILTGSDISMKNSLVSLFLIKNLSYFVSNSSEFKILKFPVFC